MEECDGETGDHDCGGDGDAGEQHHQPHMQAGASGATSALDPDLGETAGQYRAEQ